MRFIMILTFALTLSGTAVMAKTISVDVNGLVCDFCAQSVKKVIGKEDGVNDVTVDLSAKKVEIDMNDEADLSDEKITQLITDSGYDLVAINRD